MDYLKHYKVQNGFTKIAQLGDGDLALSEFGLIKLDKGENCELNSGDMENVLVILGGKCSISGAGIDFPALGERKDVFSGKPYTVYIPCGRKYEITAVTNVEIAWTASPSSANDIEPYIIAPEQVKEAHIGKENFQRDAYLMVTDEFPASHLFVGEAFVPPGNHASFPPHRHDVDDLPTEVDMEEIYFFRFSSDSGYGIQKIYTDDRSIDYVCTVKENDTTLIPEGYHPVINAPGGVMYYLWIMAGANNRKFLSVIDADFKHVMD
jgi:5-deoxy-glucuronate isomerase